MENVKKKKTIPPREINVCWKKFFGSGKKKNYSSLVCIVVRVPI